MSDILYYDAGIIPEMDKLPERIILHYNELNFCLNGLVCDRITLLIAPTNAGKSCFSSSLIVDAIGQGFKTLLFAGEDGGAEARDRIYRQYLGNNKEFYDYVPYIYQNKDRTEKSNAGENTIKHEKFVEADNYFKNKLFIYNNNIPADKTHLIECMTKAYNDEGVRFFVLDNCDMFTLDGNCYNENQAMKEICIALREFAIEKKVHILIISHIKKTERNICRPEIFDCKGTSSLTNIAKNIISLIRTDTINPSTKEYKELMKLVELNGYKPEECSAIVEILKTKGRRNGIISMGFNAISNSYYERQKSDENKNTLFTPELTPIDTNEIDDIFG